ncbi:MAG: GTPase and tRNA-U34 5-formylation enzyme TrmE, partial [uncultured Campylobacterales bacterium]
LKGDLKLFCDELREELIIVLAFIEVSIDYAEEDLPEDTLSQIYKKLDFCKDKLSNILDISNRRAGLLRGFSISIIGKPNVGKSSLLNKLLSYNRAIVSDIEGTTRDTIEEELYIGSHLVKIIDTAGIRNAKDDIEIQGILRSKEAIQNSDIVIALFDNSREFDSNDENILSLINEYKDKKEIFTYINKRDLNNSLDLSKIQDYELISADENINIIVDKLKDYLDTKDTDELMLTSSRQIDLVSRALISLNEADISELELFAFNINEAIKSIAYITKSYENDDMLDVMFGSFCLGK